MPDPIDQEDITSEVVDIEAWVEAASANPTQYRDRQVAEIVLAAIGFSPLLRDTLVLKGGTAMALAFHSGRLTGDLDFTALADPKNYDQLLTDELNAELPRAAVRLGYTNLVCRVQTIKKRPRPQNFEEHNFPALLVKVASATSGGAEEQRLNEGLEPFVIILQHTRRG